LVAVEVAAVDPHTAKLRLQVKTPVEARARVLQQVPAVEAERVVTPHFFQSLGTLQIMEP
jgi:hypothetical protein